jgi:hypothetical protein
MKAAPTVRTVKPVYNEHPWDSKKWSLFKGGCYAEVDHEKLNTFWLAGDQAGCY